MIQALDLAITPRIAGVAFSRTSLECHDVSSPGPGQLRPASLASALLVLLVAVVVTGCRSRLSDEDIKLEQSTSDCKPVMQAGPLQEPTQAALFGLGVALGHTRALAPAIRYTERLTADGYFVRGAASTVVMSLAGLGLGALAAALLLTLLTRRPTPRWAERLGREIKREIDQLRALAESGDALAKAIAQRFDEPLALAGQKARRLVERALPLMRRAESTTTAVAHLESLEHQLEGLLASVERIHLQITVWNERRLRAEDEALQGEVEAALAELTQALEELP